MNVLAINGSPRGKQANTYRILQSLLDGMRQAGAKTEIINLSKLNINYCKGCGTCLKITPGRCVIKDDMEALLEKIPTADLVIYGTPLYVFSMSGMMKTFLDRTLPLSAAATMDSRSSVEKQKILLISPCHYPHIENFSPLVETFKLMARITGEQYLGEILRTTANINDNEKQEKYSKLLNLAGQQLIESNMIDDKLLKELHEPWISIEEFIEQTKTLLKIKA
jgi:hypothetical protein